MSRQDTLDIRVVHGGGSVPPLGDRSLSLISLCSVIGQSRSMDSVASSGHVRVI